MVCFERIYLLEQYRIKANPGMPGEVHFEQTISMIVCLSKICQSDINIFLCWKSTIICLYHICQLIKDIIVCQDERETFQIIDKTNYGSPQSFS